QALIYICAIGKVLQNTEQPVYIVAYALGFALGTYLGIVIEQRLAFGQQVASLFTRKGVEMATALAAAGYPVAEVHGRVPAGELSILYVGVSRRLARRLLEDARVIDASCYCVLNDVRAAQYVARHAPSPAHTTIL